MSKKKLNGDFEVEGIIHPGPDYDKAMESIVRAWAEIVCDQIDEMHLSVAELRRLRKAFGFDDEGL